MANIIQPNGHFMSFVDPKNGRNPVIEKIVIFSTNNQRRGLIFYGTLSDCSEVVQVIVPFADNDSIGVYKAFVLEELDHVINDTTLIQIARMFSLTTGQLKDQIMEHLPNNVIST